MIVVKVIFYCKNLLPKKYCICYGVCIVSHSVVLSSLIISLIYLKQPTNNS